MFGAMSNSHRRHVLVALGLALGPVVALGFTRFAYALLLPPMREALGWSYAQAGAMNTSNAVGYVAGALGAAYLSRLLGPARAFVLALATSAAALILSGLTASFETLLALRFAGGLSTAVTFVVGSALAARIAPDAPARRSATLLALYFGGVGLGVVLSGLLVPVGIEAGGWRLGWLLLGLASAALVAPAALAAAAVPAMAGRASAGLPLRDLRSLAPTFVAYALYGAGYVSYMTFVVALLRTHGNGAATVAPFWIVLGLASSIATLWWGAILGWFRGGAGLATVSGIVLAGTLPVLVDGSIEAAFASAILFGAAFMAGPAAVTLLARRHLAQPQWTAGIALLTAAFSVGQAIGPVLSGAITDATGRLDAGLWISPLLLALAAAAALAQRSATAPVVAPAADST